MVHFVEEVPGLYRNVTVFHVYDGFYYLIYKTINNRSFLMCAVDTHCPGRASMPADPGKRLLSSLHQTREHNHYPDRDGNWLVAQLARRRILERSRTEATSLRNIYREETERIPKAAAALIPYVKIVRIMHFKRKYTPHPIPKTLQEYGAALEANPRFGNSISNEEFYKATLVDEAGDTAVLFVSQPVSQHLRKVTDVLVDTSFKVVPNTPPAYQLMTIAVILFHQAFPFVWVLMGRRTESLYDLVFAYVGQQFPNLTPDVFMTDSESGLENALRRAWPAAAVEGCWFYSANSMVEKAKNLNLTPYLANNLDARRVYKMALALAFLPHNQIEEGYEFLAGWANDHGVLAHMATFLNYVYTQWVTGDRAQLFSVFRQRRRTNNDLEVYYRSLLGSLNNTQPNIWSFTDGLRKVENEGAVTLASIQRAKQPRPRPYYLLSNPAIVRLTKDLVAERLTVGQFLESVSFQLDNLHNPRFNVEEVNDRARSNDDKDEPVQEEDGSLPSDPEEVVQNYTTETQNSSENVDFGDEIFKDELHIEDYRDPSDIMEFQLLGGKWKEESESVSSDTGAHVLSQDDPLSQPMPEQHSVHGPSTPGSENVDFKDERFKDELHIEDYGDPSDIMEFQLREGVEKVGKVEENTGVELAQPSSSEAGGPFETIICGGDMQIKQEVFEDERDCFNSGMEVDATPTRPALSTPGIAEPLSSVTAKPTTSLSNFSKLPKTSSGTTTQVHPPPKKSNQRVNSNILHSQNPLKSVSAFSLENCRICTEVFSSPSDLVEHCILKHSGELVKMLFETHGPDVPRHVSGRPSIEPKPARLVERHFIYLIPPTGNKVNAQKRCCVCAKRGVRRDSRYWCPKCEAGLCLGECFEIYHTKVNF